MNVIYPAGDAVDQRFSSLLSLGEGVAASNKGIGDAGSTAEMRMLWSDIVCLGLLYEYSLPWTWFAIVCLRLGLLYMQAT